MHTRNVEKGDDNNVVHLLTYKQSAHTHTHTHTRTPLNKHPHTSE